MLVSISLDEDIEAWRNMVTRRQMNWRQICDGNGGGSEIVRMYNAGTETHFVIDRNGRIAGSHRGARGLPAMERLVEKLLGTR